MSVNSSSSSAALLPPPGLSSPASIYYQLYSCLNSTVGVFIITAIAVASVLLLLPLYVLVLYLGHQRRRQRRQQRSGTATSHTDLFTYHMVAIELLSVLGSSLSCCGVHARLPGMMVAGIYLCFMNLSGQMYFHILTCVERYLAVVQPVTYLGLRKAKGLRIRNIAICCVWLLCFAGTGLMSVEDVLSIVIISILTLACVLAVIAFCSLSVLCVLIRPGPGDRGWGTQQVDKAKLRAFYTIVAILGVLLFRFGANILATGLVALVQLGEMEKCSMWLSVFWFCLPSSLVLPLLFLHRAGKLPCCRSTSESGQGSE